MTREARWVGSKEVTECRDSPEWDYVSGKTTCVRVFEGPYSKCLTAKPTLFAPMTGFPATMRVISVKIKRQPGNKGVLTITLEQSTTVSPPDEEESNEPQYELEWREIEKPIEQHPNLKNKDDSDIITDAHMTKVEEYFSTKSPQSRKEIYDGLTGDSGTKAKWLINKRRRGVESYVLYAPVVKVTYESQYSAKGTNCGKIIDPPAASGAPTNYKYLQTADRSTRSGSKGRWQRCKEYTGAEFWDAELYP